MITRKIVYHETLLLNCNQFKNRSSQGGGDYGNHFRDLKPHEKKKIEPSPPTPRLIPVYTPELKFVRLKNIIWINGSTISAQLLI